MRPAHHAVLALACGALVGAGRPAPSQAPGPWRQYASAEEGGFDSAALERARGFADSVGVPAVMIVQGGAVVAAWGDVARPLQCHSVRKSLLSALIGIGAAEGAIRLDATLAELGIDDVPPLTAQEKTARVADLLKARSGIYHPSAYAPESQERNLPERGSHDPGTFWYYNNWDFNALGTIYERATGHDIFADFARLIARPLGMEDYRDDLNADIIEPGKSRHAAYTFRMSTRDLARFGQLYLQGGTWNDRPIVPAAWVRASTISYSDASPGGYGYLWWVYPAGTFGPMDTFDKYAARGLGGQVLYVIPGPGLVIVLRGDTDHGNGTPGSAVGALMSRILAARTGSPAATPRFTDLTPIPLASLRPPLALPHEVAIDPAVFSRYVGDYQVAPEQRARVFLYEGRLFVDFPGRGEAELFPLSPTHYFLKVVANVRVEFRLADTQQVSAMAVNLGGREVVAPRVP